MNYQNYGVIIIENEANETINIALAMDSRPATGWLQTTDVPIRKSAEKDLPVRTGGRQKIKSGMNT